MRDCGTSPSDPKPAASTLKEDCSLLPLVGFERARTHACRVVALLDPEEIDVAVVIQLLFPEHPWACVCHLLKQWAKIRGVIGRRGLADLAGPTKVMPTPLVPQVGPSRYRLVGQSKAPLAGAHRQNILQWFLSRKPESVRILRRRGNLNLAPFPVIKGR